MTHKYTIELDDEADTVQRLNSWRDPVALTLVAQLLAQLPKPVPEEPTGDVLVVFGSAVFRPVAGDRAYWRSVVTGDDYIWSDLVSRWSQYEPVVYDRRQAATTLGEARDAYSDAMNLELRRSIAADVLEAMDVDQYLIDAVRSATPPTEEVAGAGCEHGWGCECNDEPAAADPLEALYADLKNEWELDAGDWVILRNFVERVRALTTEDTVLEYQLRGLLERVEAVINEGSSTTTAAELRGVLRGIKSNLTHFLSKAGR